MTNMNYESLRNAVAGSAVALRCRRRLQPAGNVGDKVFPPTYAEGKYALEERIVVRDGKTERVPCVLLDSVQSQANRMELALLEAARAGAITLPVVAVDFAAAGLSEVGTITSLEAPHRLADAILRDSLLKEVPFRKSPEGRMLDEASVQNATGLLGLCPTALLMGLWDSTGPRGGLGTKFQRCIVSEIVGVDVQQGVRPSSRIDPLGIQLNAGPLYEAPKDAPFTWTLDGEDAVKDKKGEPVKLGNDGKPSEANHGNVLPTCEGNHGGITMAYAEQTVVLSLPALRRLRFPVDGKPQTEADLAARTALAALGLCAAVLSIERGCDLRSRCLLVPEAGQGGWELVLGDGTPEAFGLNAEAACALLKEAVSAVAAAGLPWRKEALVLTPGKGLAKLVGKSREEAMQAGAEESGE